VIQNTFEKVVYQRPDGKTQEGNLSDFKCWILYNFMARSPHLLGGSSLWRSNKNFKINKKTPVKSIFLCLISGVKLSMTENLLNFHI